MNGLKAYMGYSREAGSKEGAYLIFAHNIKEAKCIGFDAMSGTIVGDYTDMGIVLCKDSDFLFDQVPQWSKDKIAKGVAHVVDSPPTCKQCELWGKELDVNGICEDCQDDFDGELIETKEEYDARRSNLYKT